MFVILLSKTPAYIAADIKPEMHVAHLFFIKIVTLNIENIYFNKLGSIHVPQLCLEWKTKPGAKN